MARAGRKPKRKEPITEMLGPVPEQVTGSAFHRELVVYRRTPVIDTLLDAGKLKQHEYGALAYYRDQAHKAEEDYARHNALSPEKVMGGSGGVSQADLPPIWLWTPAIAETARVEASLGILRDIARAIAVDDWSLSQWCIHRHGGRERYDGNGRFIAIVPTAEKRVMELAMLDLRHAAGRIVR